MRLTASRRLLLTSAFRLMGVIASFLVAGCAREPIQVITVGGLGFSQMGSVRRAIDKECPKANVRSAGAWDAYKSDVPRMIRESQRDHVVLVGHSLGCNTIVQAATNVDKVDLLVLIEPAGDDIRLPKSVVRCIWYRRSNFDWVSQAKVTGASPTTITGGHNDVAHATAVITGVVDAINDIPIGRDGKK